ncbi:hypothetical protein [Microbacterium sp. NPDC077184]|uniref:hypothetical protein n=1 Tax=Microbacterium sp. NPDC077184 TaxID=3154764 RepID=UPI00343ED24F
MSPRLMFPDPLAVADVLTFSGRAAALGDGNVRLKAENGVLVLSSAPLAPRTLLDTTPTVLGMRAVEVDAELVCDLVVDAAALAADAGDSRAIVLPETARTAPWAGISAPAGGWTRIGALPASVLAARAQWGIAAVAESMPADPGEDIVHTVRAAVWGESDTALLDVARGCAFAAFALGFIAGEEEVAVRTAGPWTRLSFARGHVLVRGSRPPGLGPVRSTGSSGAL